MGDGEVVKVADGSERIPAGGLAACGWARRQGFASA